MNIIKKLKEDFELAIFEKEIDVLIDYANIAIEEIFSNEIMKNIPIVKTIYSFVKINIAIRERSFIRKLFVFLKSLHEENINIESLNKFKKKFEENPKFKEKVLENILVLNERFYEYEKSAILGKLFSSLIKEDISFNRYLEMCSVLDSIHPIALKALEKQINNDSITDDEKAMLISSGLTKEDGYVETDYKINTLGNDFFNFGIKK
ncbi:MAG: hypothetical protein A2X12_11950 [Bacteroidetes bacterium GWE2_29_8]|nr:MAG: hypothetical protein A2X12_11950 [Bacteroidetes bacterium GWE2_29_8]OFY21055.1 MAG: hypothetical protein A2X02_07325 [Bacteroidetes bacterium GWF2_29_10]